MDIITKIIQETIKEDELEQFNRWLNRECFDTIPDSALKTALLETAARAWSARAELKI